MTPKDIIVAGAGVLGLWQALRLARDGHRVTLIDQSPDPLATSASRLAGAMLAPDCEAESAPQIIRDLGRQSIALWREAFPSLAVRGTLVVAAARDRAELTRFARLTGDHQQLDSAALAKTEPDLAERFTEALFFPREAHMATPDALNHLLARVRALGAQVRFGERLRRPPANTLLVDCRGWGAHDVLGDLRAVRGERLLIRSGDVSLSRPVRLLHPRHPIYVVPWGDGSYVVGATMIESEDDGPMTVRSALELLGTAYALHPAFGEAQVLETSAGVRPAFPDNVPRAIVRKSHGAIYVNGAYRHGYLLAPVLAEAVARYVAGREIHPLLREDS